MGIWLSILAGVTVNFISTWGADIRDLDKNPILRFSNKIKPSFGMENHLFGVKNDKYRTTLAKLRSSSHTLAIETGRHSRPKLQVHERLCQVCQCIEDETHLMIGCEINTDERSHLFTRVTRVYPAFESLPKVEKCRFLLSSQDNKIMTWVGKFIYKSFALRSEALSGSD